MTIPAETVRNIMINPDIENESKTLLNNVTACISFSIVSTLCKKVN